jgi:hypothetical protein
MEPTAIGRVCDRTDCPAPGVDELVLHGQDFHFCHHHAAELLMEAPEAEPTRPLGPSLVGVS